MTKSYNKKLSSKKLLLKSCHIPLTATQLYLLINGLSIKGDKQGTKVNKMEIFCYLE